jgi:phage terminase small subunit
VASRLAKLVVKAAAAPVDVKAPDKPESWPFGTAPPAAEPDLSVLTPLDYLMSVVRDTGADQRIRIQAASIAAPFLHIKKGEGGKKDDAADKAKKAGGGKFAPSAPPRLVANNTR